MALRFPVEPMRATLGTLPPDDGRWAYEVKWDGYRTLAFVDEGSLQLQSSRQLDVTAKYPELATLAGSVAARQAVLDGELVVLDDAGRPRFELMQRRATQVAFYVFDVLSVDGHDLIASPYEDRRALLSELVQPSANWMVPGHRVGDGQALLDATLEQGLEGVMAKRLGSAYRPGRRSPDWRKVKNRRAVEVTIGGFTAGSGSRATSFGALLVGVERDDGTLGFAGGVGTGFNTQTLAEMNTRLRALATAECPFRPAPPREYLRGATWVRPELRAHVEITEFTNDGLVRQASFTGLVGD